MDASVSELRAAILQAARGAGIPLAQAEDAARILAPKPALFLDLLNEPDTPFAVSGDQARGGRTLWNSPSVADLSAGYGQAKWLFAPGGAAGYLLDLGFCVDQSDTGFIIRPGGTPLPCPQRVHLPPAVHDRLKDAAAKIYVPATDASRDGAGAGADGD